MNHVSADPSREDAVAEARQAYRSVLARWGLENLSQQELNDAGALLRGQGATPITPEDIDFQAALTRLHSRRQLSPQTVEGAFRELMSAEYECDEAEWELDCHRVAMMEHARFRLPDGTLVHEPNMAASRDPHDADKRIPKPDDGTSLRSRP